VHHSRSLQLLVSLTCACTAAELPTAPDSPSFSYCAARTTGDTLCFSGDAANWRTTPGINAATQDTSYFLFLQLIAPTQPGDDALSWPGLTLTVRADRFGSCPTTRDYHVPSTTGDTVAVDIGTASGSYVADSGVVRTRQLQSYYFDGSMDLWFRSAENVPGRPSFHLVGVFAAMQFPGTFCQA